MAGDTVPTAAELLDELRREWRANPEERRTIERAAAAVQLFDLIMRPDNRATS